MKKVMVFLSVFALVISLSAQSLNEKDGKYYDASGALFSGAIQDKHPNGVIRLTASVEEGLLQGEALYYSTEGILEEKGQFSAGKKNGIWIQYNSKGSITGEAHYVAGEKNGIWTIWDDNGVKRYHMVYAMGKKIDVWKMWDENSNLVSERTY